MTGSPRPRFRFFLWTLFVVLLMAVHLVVGPPIVRIGTTFDGDPVFGTNFVLWGLVIVEIVVLVVWRIKRTGPNETDAPQRRRWQFGLWTLFVVVTVLAVLAFIAQRELARRAFFEVLEKADRFSNGYDARGNLEPILSAEEWRVLARGND